MEISDQGCISKYEFSQSKLSSNFLLILATTSIYKEEAVICRLGPNVNIKNQNRKKIAPSEKEKQFFKKKIKVSKKTELCKNWELYKDCYFKNKCSFAHGEEELRKKFTGNNMKYKTKKCKMFFEKLYCPFGSRCQYSHSLNSNLSYRDLLINYSKDVFEKVIETDNTKDFNIIRILNNIRLNKPKR